MVTVSSNDPTTPQQSDPNDDSHTKVIALWEGGTATRRIPSNGALVIGRSTDCDLSIDHGSVSRRHAIIRAGNPPTIEDLGSSNGVRVRGRRIEPGTATPIDLGEVVEVASAMIVVRAPLVTQAGAFPREQPMGTGRSSNALGWEKLVSLVAASDLNVILQGETGVGKNVAAHRIHSGSPRANGPFVAFNCTAFPEALLESELFGYVRGAFTGASQTKPGLIESAQGGTLLLDEVGEMPLATQTKLLTVIEAREVTPLGAVRSKRVDVRFVASTNRDLASDVATGRFRKDLFYRLEGISILVPPLRERRQEIPQLAALFLGEACARTGRPIPKMGSDVMASLVTRSWPGNIRELRNVVERAVVLCDGGVLLACHVEGSTPRSPSVDQGKESVATGAQTLRSELDALERQRVVEALEACGGNQTKAAQQLGMSRRALIARLEAYGIKRPRKPGG